jgi:hypothetical protein
MVMSQIGAILLCARGYVHFKIKQTESQAAADLERYNYLKQLANTSRARALTFRVEALFIRKLLNK